MLRVYYNPHNEQVRTWPDALVEKNVRSLYKHAESIAPNDDYFIFVGQELFITVLRVLVKEKIFNPQFLAIYYVDEYARTWPLHLDSDGRSPDFVNWPDINADYLLRLI